MTAKDTWKIIYVLKATYPNSYTRFTTADYDNLANAWCMVFEDYDYPQVSQGLKVFLASDTKGFPPSPGQVMDCIAKLAEPEGEQLSEGEAWALVLRALQNSAYDAVKEFDRLPDAVKRAVGDPGVLQSMARDDDFNEEVASSNFRRTYRNQIERNRESSKIPSSVKSLMQNTAEKISLKS